GELVVFGRDGQSDAGLIGAQASGPAQGLHAALMASRPGRAVAAKLQQAGCNLDTAQAIALHGPESRPGDSAHFTVSEPALVVLGAPGGPMSPHDQDVATDLLLYVRRAKTRNTALHLPPTPLADPMLDRTIQPGQAFVYEVPKGAFIQILDVQGRECSDFQAFSARSVDKGMGREIDPTATRSMTGTSYPMPGLHAKYWNT
ncbi:unnamed protein product, partial [Ectocarpus sp. 12 AP-2014]